MIAKRIEKLGLKLEAGKDFDLVNNESDPRFGDYWKEYYNLMKRKGVSQEQARRRVIGNTTLIGALMVRRGEADALICGTYGTYRQHLDIVRDVIGYAREDKVAGAMNALILPTGNIFITDTYVNESPDAPQLAAITEMAARAVSRFGIAPKVALLSNSSFGTWNTEGASKMRNALELIRDAHPDLEIDGEMQGDAALVEAIRQQAMPDSTLKGAANLLVMPNVEAANISYNLLRVSASDGVTIGPILMGMAKPVHILTQISSVRRIVNMVALAAVDAQNGN